MVNRSTTLSGVKSPAPAAGRFGIAGGKDVEPRAYRPSGCPSLEQFEAQYRIAGDAPKPAA